MISATGIGLFLLTLILESQNSENQVRILRKIRLNSDLNIRIQTLVLFAVRIFD